MMSVGKNTFGYQESGIACAGAEVAKCDGLRISIRQCFGATHGTDWICNE